MKKDAPNIGPKEQQPKKLFMVMITIGLLLIFAGTMMPLFAIMPDFSSGTDSFKYVYTTGALLLLIGRLLTPYKGDIFRVKRLSRIEFWSALFFGAAVFFMFYEGAGRTDWLAFTLAGGVLQIYTSIMIPRALAKYKDEDCDKNCVK